MTASCVKRGYQVVDGLDVEVEGAQSGVGLVRVPQSEAASAVCHHHEAAHSLVLGLLDPDRFDGLQAVVEAAGREFV